MMGSREKNFSVAPTACEEGSGEDPSEADSSHEVFSEEEVGECDCPIVSSLPVIDWAHLHQLSDGNCEFELELLRLFVEDSWQHFAALKQAVIALLTPEGQNQSNFWHAERFAHYLMGASANVGAWKVQQAADLLEQQFRSHTVEGVPHLLVELETGLVQVTNIV
jgi:HPt (histidine-containing phosphotransfer) domain-containing protein